MNLVTDPVAVANDLRPVLLKLARHLRRELHELNVTPAEVSVLAQLATHQEIGIRQLAELEGVSQPRMSKVTQELLIKGMLKRHRGVDRRRVGLAVTDRGLAVVEAVRRHRTAWLAARLQRLEPDELEAVESAIPLLAKLLEETD
jgi:DNA-binding MarR family transcriptional regulator